MDTSLSKVLTLNTSELSSNLNRIRTMAIGMLVAGLVLSAIGYIMPGGSNSLLPSYLVAYLFWFGVSVGCLGWFMIHNVTGGGWGFILRRLLEAGSRLIPLMAVLYVPIALGITKLYPWTHPETVHHAEARHVISKQMWWLNTPFFLTRVVILFAFWIIWMVVLNRLSAEQDRSDDPKILHRMNLWSAAGLPLYVIAMTVMAIDWVMTLTPAWISTIVGLLFIVSQGLSVLALMAILVTSLGKGSPLIDMVPQRFYRDIGNFTLAFVLLWSYMSFSQYLISYSGNTAEESVWYVDRARHGWPIIGFGLLIFHFAFPFLVLLSSTVKVRIQNMAKLGFYLIVMRFFDLLYWVQPAGAPQFRPNLAISPLDIGLFLAMGGLWLLLWTMQMQNKNLLPTHDERIQRHWPEVEHATHATGVHTPAHTTAHGSPAHVAAAHGGEA